MDIERLNKFQIVLLTLLVSFVTSIATGIVTVSLMEQAPPVIPQTINRVVERTVERVVPKETQTATVITTEKTVVVKESELVAQAVSRVRPSVIRVHAAWEDGKAGEFLSRGFVIAEGHAIASIKGAADQGAYAVVAGDKTLAAKTLKVDEKNTIVLLELAEQKDERVPAAALGVDAVVLGQTVIAVAGNPNLKVATGIVTEVADLKSESGESSHTSFMTDIPNGELVSGSPLLNTDGAVIGMFNGARIVSTSIFTTLIKSLKPVDAKTGTTTTAVKSQ